jgi:membrane protease YdiL (CAAX protease family)
MKEMPGKFSLLTAGTLLVMYALVRFVWLDQLDKLGEYASYLFELAFAAFTVVIFRQKQGQKSLAARIFALDGLAALCFGFVIYRLGSALNLPNPFDFNSGRVLLLLLVVGPILEELVFRGALWRLLQVLRASSSMALMGTTAFFSFSHFFSWWSVPAELHTFIVYQTVYTLFLGWYCGWRRVQTASIFPAILVHAFFNLGFYLGWRI